MKQQVVLIGGGDPHETYEDYISWLKSYEIKDLSFFQRKRWHTTLHEELGDNFEVILAKMPNDRNAKYLEWKIWFEKIIPFLKDGIILIGSSLGGIFLTKYLSENIFQIRIRGCFFVAAPFDTDNTDYSLADFILSSNLDKLTEQGGNLHFYHSKDDSVVPFADLKKYLSRLPNAKFTVFENRDHFGQEEFPEIIEDIKVLVN